MGEETKNTGTEKDTARACCTPEAMQDFFQKMAGCWSGPGGTADCRAMMKGMQERFCGKESEGTKTGCEK